MDNQEVAKCIQNNKHPNHPLKEVYKNAKFECKSCKSKGGKGMRFRCDQCDFDMHIACATSEDSLSSFTHPQHDLQLTEITQLSFHKCNLCQDTVKGTVYSCKACNFYMHPICGELPEHLSNHAMHPPHSMKIQVMENSKCDVCDKTCKQWRYYCGVCDVHIHVGCLSGKNSGSGGVDDDVIRFGGHVLGGIAVGVAENLVESLLV